MPVLSTDFGRSVFCVNQAYLQPGKFKSKQRLTSINRCDFRDSVYRPRFGPSRNVSSKSWAYRKAILCVKKTRNGRSKQRESKCKICSKKFDSEKQFALHIFGKSHLICVRNVSSKTALVSKSHKAKSWISKEELEHFFKQESDLYPKLFKIYEDHLELLRLRRQRILDLSLKYPAGTDFFKPHEDLGFFAWEIQEEDLLETGREIAVQRWMVENPARIEEIQGRLVARPPPQLSIPALPFSLTTSPSKSQSMKSPKGFPFNPPPFLPLLASRSKGYDLTDVDVVSSCMALRIIGMSTPSDRKKVRVQRYRHLLLLHWELPFTSELMDPGFQFERALTGRSTDKPQESLEYTFTARVGEIGPLRVLCCGEVDASDEHGRAVEVKSNPKAIESADVKMQLMLLGVKKTAVIQSKRRAKDKFTEVCRIQTHDMDSTETVLYAASEEGASDLESCEFMGNTATKSLDLEGEGEGDEEDPLQGVGAKGLRIRYVLDWLRTRPELMGDDPTDQPSTSRPFNLSFDEIGNPVLTRTVERYLPREDLCEEMFGECFRHEYASSEQ